MVQGCATSRYPPPGLAGSLSISTRRRAALPCPACLWSTILPAGGLYHVRPARERPCDSRRPASFCACLPPANHLAGCNRRSHSECASLPQWKAYHVSNKACERCEKYCREEWELPRVIEGLDRQARKTYELDNRKGQLMAICQVALGETGQVGARSLFPGFVCLAPLPDLLALARADFLGTRLGRGRTQRLSWPYP
jgi:hypothetical protein